MLVKRKQIVKKHVFFHCFSVKSRLLLVKSVLGLLGHPLCIVFLVYPCAVKSRRFNNGYNVILYTKTHKEPNSGYLKYALLMDLWNIHFLILQKVDISNIHLQYPFNIHFLKQLKKKVDISPKFTISTQYPLFEKYKKKETTALQLHILCFWSQFFSIYCVFGISLRREM